jgi:hypothetical protein
LEDITHAASSTGSNSPEQSNMGSFVSLNNEFTQNVKPVAPVKSETETDSETRRLTRTVSDDSALNSSAAILLGSDKKVILIDDNTTTPDYARQLPSAPNTPKGTTSFNAFDSPASVYKDILPSYHNQHSRNNSSNRLPSSVVLAGDGQNQGTISKKHFVDAAAAAADTTLDQSNEVIMLKEQLKIEIERREYMEQQVEHFKQLQASVEAERNSIKKVVEQLTSDLEKLLSKNSFLEKKLKSATQEHIERENRLKNQIDQLAKNRHSTSEQLTSPARIAEMSSKEKSILENQINEQKKTIKSLELKLKERETLDTGRPSSSSSKSKAKDDDNSDWKSKYVESCIKITDLIREKRNLLYEIETLKEQKETKYSRSDTVYLIM